MKKMLIFLTIIFVVGCKLKDNNSISGDWKFQYLNDTHIKTIEELAPTLFLNQMIEGIIVSFKNDSFFVNHKYYGLYDDTKKHIKINGEADYLIYSLEKDTLTLTPHNEKFLSLKFTR